MAGCACGCDGKSMVLISACSGAANTGLLADQVARGLRDLGAGSLTCLAALGAGNTGFVESAKMADRNIVIDGCLVGCGTKIFAKQGMDCEQYVMTDFGIKKGRTAITAEIVADTVQAVKMKICEMKK